MGLKRQRPACGNDERERETRCRARWRVHEKDGEPDGLLADFEGLLSQPARSSIERGDIAGMRGSQEPSKGDATAR